eukprot:TRINITY_DN6268_c0_g1_i1.p1 TRINITY_DN6268_c0_g1~~TRINITY_DN6268_c0_g1_i1.p1  ORF type:complete len:953 (+),score=159.95 TRINITY_DN6268_c0_g1_i1:65-2923(+)
MVIESPRAHVTSPVVSVTDSNMLQAQVPAAPSRLAREASSVSSHSDADIHRNNSINGGGTELSEGSFLKRGFNGRSTSHLYLGELTEEHLKPYQTSQPKTIFKDESVSLHSKGSKGKRSVLAKSEQTLQKLTNALRSDVLQPDDMRLLYWDALILACVMYYGIFVPCQYAMERHILIAGEWGHLVLEIICTIVFIIDIFIRLNTAYLDENTGSLIENPAAIRTNYFHTGLFRDILAAVPIDLIILLSLGQNFMDGWVFIAVSHLRFLKVLVVPKLFQVVTPVRLEPSSVRFHFTIVPMLRLLFYCTLAVNSISVCWILLNKEGPRGVSTKSYSYIQALYWTLYTVTTVGYGDVEVDTAGKQLFASALFIVGVIVHGIVISKISSRVQKGDVESERNDKMKETLSVLKKFNIPDQLACEVLAFQYHQLHSDVSGSLTKVLQTLPSVMRDRVGLFVRMKFICQVPMFKEQPIDCLVGLANALKNIVMEPERTIIKANDIGHEMFFLGHGFAEVTSPEGDHWGVIKPGGFFGEMALLTDSKRTASIMTLTYCKLFKLEKGDFFGLIRKHPEMKEAVAQEMRKRQIQQSMMKTKYVIEMTGVDDFLGITWEHYENGFIVSAVDHHGAAHRAKVSPGMHLVAIGDDDSPVEDLQLIEETFNATGIVTLTLVPPTALGNTTDSPGKESNTLEPGDSGEVTGSQTASHTPFVLDIKSENGSIRGLNRAGSEHSVTSDPLDGSGFPFRGRARSGSRREKLPDITLHPPPTPRVVHVRTSEVVSRLQRLEEKSEVTHATIARVEQLMEAMLTTLGLVVEKTGPNDGKDGYLLPEQPVPSPPPPHLARRKNPLGSPESILAKSIQSLQDGASDSTPPSPLLGPTAEDLILSRGHSNSSNIQLGGSPHDPGSPFFLSPPAIEMATKTISPPVKPVKITEVFSQGDSDEEGVHPPSRSWSISKD